MAVLNRELPQPRARQDHRGQERVDDQRPDFKIQESIVCPTLFALLELGLERGHWVEQRIAACLRRLPQADLFSPPILA